MSLPLNESARAVADASGRAVATLQPMRAFERWRITRTAVQSDSTPEVPTCKIYRSMESPSTLVEGTYTGTLDSSDTEIVLENGERLLAVWEGATVGSNCTVTVSGERNGR
jgi:hypothetical protein